MKLKLSKSALGVLIYTGAMFLIVLLNICVKRVIKDYGLPTWEVLFLRQAIIVACLVPCMIKSKFNFFDKRAFKPNFIRNVIFAFSTFLLYTGMARVPMNDATAITFIAPIIGSVLAVKLLGEKGSKAIFAALVLAIIGVCVIKQPGFSKASAIGYGALLLCVIMRGYIVILNKRLAGKFNTMTMMFYTNIIMLGVSALFFWQFKPVPLGAFSIMLLVSLLFFTEVYMVYKAYKYCNALTLQPLDFSRLLFSMCLSSIILGEAVMRNQILGGLIIVGGYGLIILCKRKKAVEKK